MLVAPAGRRTVTAGSRGAAQRPRRRRLRSDNGLIKVHVTGPRARPPMPGGRGGDRGPGGPARVAVGVTGPSPVPIWNAKIIKCRARFTVDSGHMRIGSPRPPTFSIFGRQ